MIHQTIQEISTMIHGTLYSNQIEMNIKVHGVCIDSRQYQEGNIFFSLLGEKVDSHIYIKDLEVKGCSLFIISNIEYAPTNAAYIVVEDTIEALQQLAKNYRSSLSTKIVGITGSNGKTSCKDILAAALSSVYKTQKTIGNKNNEIGVPLTLLSLDKDCEVAIVEMGMEKHGDIIFLNDMVQQNYAILTNVGDAHLLYMKSKENIAVEKLHIMDNLNSDGLFVYCGDDKVISKVISDKEISDEIHIQTYGGSFSNDLYLTRLSQYENGITFISNKSNFEFHLSLLGKHQAINALGVIQICYALQLSDEQIQEGFNHIEMTSMRNEIVHINKCCILNDAYKSNPQSALAALDTFEFMESDYKIAVLADMLELGENTNQIHYEFGENLVKYQLQEIICIGELSKHMIEGYKHKAGSALTYVKENNEDAYEYLKDKIHEDCMMVFKGSRGMALDTIINKLKEYGEINE